MSPGPEPLATDTAERAQEDRNLDEVIFRRDLYEVHLLMDFISGRTDKTLDDLEITTPDGTRLKGVQVVEAIAKLRYPPDPPPAKSANAALLLAAKNNLTLLAQPARGINIAFTAMFVGFGYGTDPEAAPSPLRRAADWLRARLGAGPRPRRADVARSRTGLAREAFPGLITPVCHLRWLLIGLLYFFFLVWLPLTAATYWDVNFLKATLQPLEQAAKDRAGLGGPLPNPAECDAAAVAAQQTDAQRAIRTSCARLGAVASREAAIRADLTFFIGCGTIACVLPHPMRWNIVPAGNSQTPEHYAASLLAVFANNVLPLMFGLLGACTRMLRVIQYKVRDSLLGPRDLLLTLIGLLIGAVAGFAVGLYLTPAEITGSAGNLALSAAGLGFLAGYGSDHFLQMLDSLLDRIFAGHTSPEAAGAAKVRAEADARAAAAARAAAETQAVAGARVAPAPRP